MGHFLSTSPIMPNLGSLCHPHGPEDAPVVNRADPGQLQQIQKFSPIGPAISESVGSEAQEFSSLPKARFARLG